MGSQPTKGKNQHKEYGNGDDKQRKRKPRKYRKTQSKETEISTLLKKPQQCNAVWDFRVQSSGWWIQFMCPVGDDIYTWCGATKVMSRINTTGKVIKNVEFQAEFDHIDIEHVCVSPLDSTFWFCCGVDSIFQVDSEDQSHRRFRSNGRPFSLCVTQTGSVVVAMMGKVDIYSKAGVTLYTTNFEIKNINIEINKPCKVKECLKTRRLVYLNDNFQTSSVVMMNGKLGFEWVFDGESHVSDDGKVSPVKYSSFHDFKSHDVSFDENGHLFIADFHHACVLELNVDGKFLRTFADSRNEGLELYCVHVKKDRTVILGYRHRQVDKRLHIVKQLKYK